MRCFLFVLGLWCWSVTEVPAQIVETNHRAQNRRALRDARKHPAPYKDSHLAVGKASLKRGEGGRSAERNKERASYKFDNIGAARVSEPSAESIRLRKKKKAAVAPPLK